MSPDFLSRTPFQTSSLPVGTIDMVDEVSREDARLDEVSSSCGLLRFSDESSVEGGFRQPL
jgi:hypothetical protein